MPETVNPNQPELTTDGLQAKLRQQGHAGSVSVFTDEQGRSILVILPPGIAIEDIRAFLTATLAELGDDWDILPASLPVDGIQLSSLTFSPAAAGAPFVLDFTIAWPSAHWDIIPGVLALASPAVDVNIAGKSPGFDRMRVSGAVDGVIEIAQIPIEIEVELPGGLFEARLKEPDAAQGTAQPPPKTGALLRVFQVGGDASQADGDGGFDLGPLALRDLTILGNIPGRRLFLHLALGDVQLGPGRLDTQLTIDYFGGPNGRISGQVWGQYIVADREQKPLLALLLAAEYDGPGKNWRFEGGVASDEDVTIKDVIAAFTDTDGIPGVFDQLHLKYLHLAYETAPGNFEFQCDVEVDDLFSGIDVEMIVEVKLHRVSPGQASGYEKTFSGRLVFTLDDDTELEFDLFFDQSPAGKATDTTFIAAYKDPLGKGITIENLIHLVDADVDVPLSIALKDAVFIYDRRSGRTTYLFGVDIDGGIDLADLPLVGKVLPSDAGLTYRLQPLVALGTPDAAGVYFAADELTRLGALLPGGGISLPGRDIREQLGLGVHVALGKDLTADFDLPIRLKGKDQKSPPAGQSPTAASQAIQTTDGQMSASPSAVAVTPAPAGSSAGGIQWIKVGKRLGPLQFNKIGVQFESDTRMVWAYLDAGLNVAALTFTLNGLGVGTPIDKLEPHFRLLGIGIDYKSGPVEIGASFLRLHIPAGTDASGAPTPAYDEYSGLATIKTPSIGLSAIGSYSDRPDYKSLFIYAVLNAPLGGPSFFFVTGLAVGFGFNRAVKVPDVSQVGQFPLVNLAVGGAGSAPPDDPAGRTDYIHDILDKLRDSIYPLKGQYFVAAGIRFTSFQLIDSFALLIVSFGEHFEVDVLGLSTVVVPAPVPGGAKVTPIAEIQLALKAVFNPSEGVISVEAQLTANSFILDRNCHLTGGFAFYAWFGGPHQGEFVLSVGGFHPDFRKPEHYPTVPRLGLNWQVTPELSIKGGLYFALCPHMVMAGGRLEALYKSGSTKAWFTLEANFLLCWKPYYYDARASLEIGVEYTYHLMGTHHINVSVGAEVHLWGPDFAGHANVHLWCVTFDIDFGAATTPKLEPVDWNTFRHSFLPEDESKMVHITVMNGLLRKETVAGREQHVINPRDFQLGVELVAPYSAFAVGDDHRSPVRQLRQTTTRGATRPAAFHAPAGGALAQADGEATITTGAFGIAPMNLNAGQVESTLSIRVERENGSGKAEPAGGDFSFRPVLKRVPRAMWGEKLQQDMNGERYVENAPLGMELAPATPPTPGETKWISRGALQFATSLVEGGIGFEPLTNFEPRAPEQQESAAGFIKAHLTDAATMAGRREVLEALGFDYDRLDLQLSPALVDALVMEPQIGALV